MAHEVVRAKLVFRVEPELLQILFPSRELGPPPAGEIRVAFHVSDGSAQQDQVAALLDRHFEVFLAGTFAATVDLPVGLRINANVVRRERKLPLRRGAINHVRRHQGLGVGWTHQQKLGCRRVNHIHGGDAAIAGIFFGEQQRLAMGIGRQAMSGQRLPISQSAHLRVLLPTDCRQIGHEFLVE